jgi:hypothetical protein
MTSRCQILSLNHILIDSFRGSAPLEHFRNAYLMRNKMTHLVHLQPIRIIIYKMKFRFWVIGIPSWFKPINAPEAKTASVINTVFSFWFSYQPVSGNPLLQTALSVMDCQLKKLKKNVFLLYGKTIFYPLAVDPSWVFSSILLCSANVAANSW